MTRVLLVEDHSAFRQALAFMIDREPDMEVVGQAGTTEEASPYLVDVDVAVLDLDLGTGSGVDVIPDLRRASPESVVLILTASHETTQIARAVEAGAAAVLHKSAPLTEIIDAVRRLSRGEAVMSPQDVVGLLRLANQRRAEQVEAHAIASRLTPREIDVLRALARGASDKDIAQELHVSPETVRTHMVNILGKLNASSRLQALVLAIQYGLVEIGRDGILPPRE